MGKRLVVDFRIAAIERDSLFTSDWHWPVNAETYDDPLREFVEWCSTIPAQLNDKPELRTAYELAEADLLVDLASIGGAWIDVSTARQLDLRLTFGATQRLYEMLDQDRFAGFSPINDARIAGELALRSPIRRASRFLKKTVRGVRSVLKGRPNVHSISANPLLFELTGGQLNLFRLAYANVAVQRSRSQRPNTAISELASEIEKQLLSRLADVNHAPTENFNSYIHELVAGHLTNGWYDRDFTPGFTPTSQMALFTGTGGNYLARVVSQTFQKNGARVIRTTHGGDTALFNDPLWPSIELPFADTYVSFGTRAAELVQDAGDRHAAIRRLNRSVSVVAAGSEFHQQILDHSSASAEVKTVHVISASFSGTRRAIPNIKIHDVVYMEWHRRLLTMIAAAGFNTVAKRHPKGNGADIPIFDDVATTELRLSGMADTFDRTDAYVADIAGSAFIEALCTLKPIVLIDIPNRRLTEDARTQLSKSIVIVRASFDEHNRVIVDSNCIVEGLREPVDLAARHQFISDYLTSSSDRRDELIALAQG